MHLVFVYNADAGLFSMLTYYAHKIVSPQTYACSLCALTYGNLGMKRAWKRFVTGLDATIEFLHRDELAERYGVRDVPLPAVFRPAAAGLEVWVDAPELNACEDLDALVRVVRARIEQDS